MKALLKKARRVRFLAMDVDGVLTDGSIIVLDSGEEVKFWNVRDRIAFFMLEKTGEQFFKAWITGRKSRQVETRGGELKLDALRQDCADKGKALEEMMARFKVSREETLFIGDDLVDLPAFRRAGLAVCPADAPEEIKAACDWITRAPGGRGVFREVVEGVLKARGLWKGVLDRFEKP